MEPHKLLILGTGYCGREIARLARARNYPVMGTTRDDATAEELRALGAEPVDWSIGDPTRPWMTWVDRSTTVIYSIPTLFRDYQLPDGDDLPRHIAPLQPLLVDLETGKIRQFIYLSSTSVYGDHQGHWVDESTPCHPDSAVGKMRLEIENHLLGLDVDFAVTICRLVGIYGPGRTLFDYIKRGRYALVDGGKKITNRIHVHDIARAVLAISTSGPTTSRVFNLTDGHPQQVRDLVEYICEATDLPWPREESLEDYARRRGDPNAVARWTKQLRVLNDRLRQELNFELTYPDVFAGYQAILNPCPDNAPDHG